SLEHVHSLTGSTVQEPGQSIDNNSMHKSGDAAKGDEDKSFEDNLVKKPKLDEHAVLLSNEAVQNNAAKDKPDDQDQNNEAPATPCKYVCRFSDCTKRFKKNWLLKRHERSHAGVKPFLCKWPGCSYASEDRANTIRHIRDHLKRSTGDDHQDPKMYLEVVHELLY